jgi:hypothetical protein
MRVRIIGLTEAADLMKLNGVVACLGPWNAERGRWQVAHGTRTLLLREIKLRPVEDEEPAVASAAEVAQLREAECLAEAERRAAAAQAAAAAAAARAMVDAATATTCDAAVQAAVAANAVQIVLHGKLVPVTCQVEARRCMYRFMYRLVLFPVSAPATGGVFVTSGFSSFPLFTVGSTRGRP